MQQTLLGDPALHHLAEGLAAAGRRLAARGHCAATSSNFSARAGEDRFVVSRSGVDKHELRAADFLLVDAEGELVGAHDPDARASAETALHLLVYRVRAHARVVLHTHPVSATVLSLERAEAGESEVRLRGYEMLKALAGVDTHEHEERVPIVANGQDMRAVAAAVRARLDDAPDAHGVLLAGHGLYTWGRSLAEAIRHAEALDFLFECALRRGTIR